MESFRWDTCFVTGLALVDEQHHCLVDVINRFGALLTQPEGTTAEDIERVYGELTAYAGYHFHEEEQLMAQHGLDSRHIQQHHDEHVGFLLEVTRMRAAMSTTQTGAAEALLKFLIHWLAYHILGLDQEMARQMTAIAAGNTAQNAFDAVRKDMDPPTEALLHALDSLFRQVSERNRELFQLNQTLETRVVERTQELSAANQRLEDMAMTDLLTGLPNRRHGMRSLEREWQTARRHETPLACMMIDADGFKTINDTCGHDAGDEVLRQLSRHLLHGVRSDDIVCRLGGDEFLIVCARTTLDGALTLAEKLRQDVAALRVPAGDGEWCGSISIGVAVRSDAMKGFDDLIKRADEGVYLAKRNGRNRVATVCAPD